MFNHSFETWEVFQTFEPFCCFLCLQVIHPGIWVSFILLIFVYKVFIQGFGCLSFTRSSGDLDVFHTVVLCLQVIRGFSCLSYCCSVLHCSIITWYSSVLKSDEFCGIKYFFAFVSSDIFLSYDFKYEIHVSPLHVYRNKINRRIKCTSSFTQR